LNPTVKIASAYKCDFGILGNCQGYLVNSNYAFWDGHQFMDSHDQCHLITSCNQIPDVCDIRTDFSCDKGEYVCQPLHSSGSWCQGTVLSRTDPEPCPEQVTGKYCRLLFGKNSCVLHMLMKDIASLMSIFACRLPRIVL
jgi:prepilin-type processing-associated H-X9-DG protein